ncbi:uncharacterized protein LOC111268071 isoform X2 [Varroa jacobsoni]|nr:uncharacterized protein LOC111250759 isoform X2 [Varroa destructor]XP_022702536.1 uncharacterized protein LOC111268071 isoform X2 [Varroa jacobsoni]
MFAFLIDRSPSTNDNLETFVGYIVKRKLADAFMRMKFDKNFQHDCVVMTCCDSETKNLSNSNQEKKINHHCVELIDGGVINPAKVTSLKEKLNLRPENEQFSNLLSGLMTAADIINRHSEEASGYSDIELMIFSDLGFDVECTTFIKMKNVLKQVLSDAILTVVSDRDILSQDTYNKSIMFFGEIFSGVTSMSYQDAMRRSEEWSMKELMPTKFSANIRLFEEELPVEAYLICAEKNESILENRMERVGSDQDAAEGEGFTAAVSTIKPRKSLVKLTDKGFYEKDPDGNVVTVHPERTVMAYRFGTTAVPSSKPLKEYIKTSESFKGYVVKGWYPSHQFLLHLSGGRGYHVFSSASDGRVALFDTLLHLCAYRGHSLLVDYAYATRFASKPGVLVPHLQKHCFVFFDLIYQDNMNYLPRYDPIATTKPKTEHLKEIAKVIGDSGIASLELKYDPFVQQIFEDVWKGRIDEMSRTFVEKFATIQRDKDQTSSIVADAADLAERADGIVKRMVVEDKAKSPEEDKITFRVEKLDKDADEFRPVKFSQLFA